MALFIAIHNHEYGTSVNLFNSDQDAEAIFNALPNPEFGDDEDEDSDLTRVEFASRININFEPELGETLTVEAVPYSKFDTVDFTDFT